MPRPLKEEKLLTEEPMALVSPSSCPPEEAVEEVVVEEASESPPTTEEAAETEATADEPNLLEELPVDVTPLPVIGAVEQYTLPNEPDELDDEESNEPTAKRYFSAFTQGVSIYGQFTKFRQGHEFTDPGLIAYLKEHQFPLTEV